MWGITNNGAAQYSVTTVSRDKRNTRKRRIKHNATIAPELKAIMATFGCGYRDAERILREARKANKA